MRFIKNWRLRVDKKTRYSIAKWAYKIDGKSHILVKSLPPVLSESHTLSSNNKKMKLTKEQALEKIEELKKYVDEVDTKKEEKVIGIAIRNRFTGEIIFQSTKTTYKDAIIEKGDADLNGANLRDANLSGADLSGADLNGANLRYANLSDTNLRDANLSGADLNGADLNGANLSGADLNGANLRDAELQNVKFYGRGGNRPLKRSQLPSFLSALGFIIED